MPAATAMPARAHACTCVRTSKYTCIYTPTYTCKDTCTYRPITYLHIDLLLTYTLLHTLFHIRTYAFHKYGNTHVRTYTIHTTFYLHTHTSTEHTHTSPHV